MSARHTSAALSRRLREAGLEQRVVPGSDLTRYWLGDQLSDSEAIACGWDRIARALRLDEVLEEIAPLLKRDVGDVLVSEVYGDLSARFARESVDGWTLGDTPVEAAGLVLAQLLEARRG